MEHKYFRNEESTQVRGFAQDGSQDHLIPAGWLECDQEQAAAIAAPKEAPITVEGLKAIVTAFRWEVETGGITLPGGIKVATALDDQNRITTVVANARLAGLEQVKFKAASGWTTLAVAEVEGIAAAVALHVQACFAAECAHHYAIDAIALIEDPAERQAALDGYDEGAGWPT
ncbi:UNVERIFIED_ORG: hypothetical protein HNP28_003711 [Comamonas terrigena]